MSGDAETDNLKKWMTYICYFTLDDFRIVAP